MRKIFTRRAVEKLDSGLEKDAPLGISDRDNGMVGGYTGKLLRVNLTRKESVTEAIDYGMARLFIGGRGYCSRLLYDEVSPETDPLSPANKIICGTGPVTGTPVSGGSRYIIVTKSPETNLFLESYAGGFFPAEIKFAGYDFIVIEGKAKSPTYVWIYNEKIEFRDASHLWGKSAWEAETQLKDEVGDKAARVAVIGPAGERLSNLAIVQNDYYHHCARGGIGAVFGSKNLKAIVIRGTKSVCVAHPDKLLNYLMTEVEEKVKTGRDFGEIADRMKYGTPLTLNITNSMGILPTRNFKEGEFEGASKIDGYAFREKVVADSACFACNIGCTKYTRVTAGAFAGVTIGGPEYETLGMLGANIGVDSIDAVIYMNALCDSLGLDTIGTGNAIAWAMECYERGILSKTDVDGLDLRFGNVGAAIRLISMIAYGEGIGKYLAQGVKRAAEEVGRGSDEFAMHSKGLEYPAYRPGPNSPGFALAYATAERGACHRRAWPALAEQALKPFVTEGRAKLVKRLYDQHIPWHCALTCDIASGLSGLGHYDAANILSFVTGWDITKREMQDLCERVASLIRAFNVRQGASRRDDTLAPRSFEIDAVGRATGEALTREMLDAMLDEYYALRGWDKEGIPTRKTLVSLGMRDIADDLDRRLNMSLKQVR